MATDALAERCVRYLRAPTPDRDAIEAWEDLQYEAERGSMVAWQTLETLISSDLDDAALGAICADPLASLLLMADEPLERTVVSELSRHPIGTRLLAALRRYDRKLDVFYGLLETAGAPESLAINADIAESVDVSIPNPWMHRSSSTEEAVLGNWSELKPALLRGDETASGVFLNLRMKWPLTGWKLSLGLVAEADDSRLPWIAVHCLEDLIVHEEPLLSRLILDELAHNARFRAALTHCDLDLSEAFLDHAIAVLRSIPARGD